MTCKYYTCDITVHNEFVVLYSFHSYSIYEKFLKIALHAANEFASWNKAFVICLSLKNYVVSNTLCTVMS